MNVAILFFTVLINNINAENSGIYERCVSKCCPLDQYVSNTDCVPKTSEDPDFWKIPVYDKDLKKVGIIRGHLQVVIKPIFKKNQVQSWSDDTYLLMNSSVVINFEEENLTVDNDYCVDFYSEDDNSNETQVTFWFLDNDPTNKVPINVWLKIKLAALFTSSFFLLLVIIAYILVKELRDLKGKIRLAFVINLFGIYFSLACLQVYYSYVVEEIISKKTCLLFSTILYYFSWAGSCWMNVSIYDIWVTISGYRTVAVDHPEFRDRDRRTFLRLFAYAFGVPCVLVSVYLIMYILKDRSDVINIIMSNGECSINNKNSFNYILYVPMFVFQLVNCILYLLVAEYLWIRNRQSRRQLKNVNRKDIRNISFIMHIKIWTLTGVTWIVEVISGYYQSEWWQIFDFYNICLGVGLFIIIICNKQSLKLISKRFKNNMR